MPFIVLLLYLVFTFIRPHDLIPWMTSLGVMQWLGALGLLCGFLRIPVAKTSFRSIQIYLMLVMIAAIAVSVVIGQRWIGGAFYAVQQFAITAAVFYMIVVNVDTPRKLRIILGIIPVFMILVVFQGWLALNYGVYREVFVLDEVIGFDMNDVIMTLPRVRGAGFLNDPNDLAQVLVMVLPFIALAWRHRKPIRNLGLVIVPSAVVLYGISLTRSRGSVVSLFVLLMLALRRRLGGLLATISSAVLAGGLALVIAGGRAVSDESSNNRLDAWAQGFNLFKQHPIFGVGYGFFNDYHELTAHNSFVLCFTELGMFGYLVWLAMILATVYELRAIEKVAKKDAELAPLSRYAVAIQLSLYGFLVAAFFLSRTYSVSLYILIGLTVAAAGTVRARNIPVPVPQPPQLVVRAAVAAVASMVVINIMVRLR